MAVAAPQSNGNKSSGGFFSELGAKLRTLSPPTRSTSSAPSPQREFDEHSTTSTKIDERSVSRGREAFQSSGRGGLGNIRQASQSRDRPSDGPDDFSATRGREPAASPSRQPFYSTGRGGAGNIRSPSSDPNPTSINDPHEAEVVRKHNESEVPHSSGRGGLGNISRSRSRDPNNSTRPALSPPRHSTGRGGAGNVFAGDAHQGGIAEEEDIERRRHALDEGVHSTGRGGYANLTSVHSPPVEHHPHAKTEFESSGRGGAGNIHDRHD